MKKAKHTILISILILLISFNTIISFSENSNNLNIKFPKLTDTIFFIDNVEIKTFNFDYSPIIVEGVIYVPLTYNTLKMLNLDIEYNSETFNIINSNKDIDKFNFNNLKSYNTKNRNLKSYSISPFLVTLNGKNIAEKEYSLILLNKVIYIPFTYDNIKKLNWDSYYSKAFGLKIYTNKNIERILYPSTFDKEIEFIQMQNKKVSYKDAKYYMELIYKASEDYGINVHWIMAMIWLESNYDKDCEYKTAIGLMQMLISTAKTMNITREQLHDPAISIDSGVRYLKNDLDHYNGNLDLATLAYNQGSVRVDKGNYKTWYLENIKKKFETIQNFISNE